MLDLKSPTSIGRQFGNAQQISTQMVGTKSYAVVIGRQNNVVHDNWDDFQANVGGLDYTVYQSFFTRQEAETWLELRHTRPSALKPYNRSMILPTDDPNTIYMYTDGSFYYHTDPITGQVGCEGGWSVVWVQNGQITQEWYGRIPYSADEMNSSRDSELYAVGQGLLSLLYAAWTPLHIRVRSDYVDVIRAYNTPGGKLGHFGRHTLASQIMSESINFLRSQLGSRVSFEHVFSHSVDPYNRRADILAKMGRELSEPQSSDYNLRRWAQERYDEGSLHNDA
jgi:ribonuclease HI